MTLTLVKIINIEILYDLDWNLTFVEDSGDLNFWIEEDSPGPRVSGDSDDQDIPDQRSQIQVDSDQAIQILIVPWFHHNRTQNIFSWDGKSNSLILFPGDRRNIQRLIFFVNIFHWDHKCWALIGWGSPVNHFQLSRSPIGGILSETGWHRREPEEERFNINNMQVHHYKTEHLCVDTICNICPSCV